MNENYESYVLVLLFYKQLTFIVEKTQKQNGKKPGKKQPGSSTSIGNVRIAITGMIYYRI